MSRVDGVLEAFHRLRSLLARASKFGADIRAFPAAALADEHGSMSDKRTLSGPTSAKVIFWADSGRAASIEQAVFAYRARLSGLSQIRNNPAGFEIQ